VATDLRARRTVAGSPVEATAPRVTSRASERIRSLEVFRVLAIFGIVWFPTELAPGGQFAYAGLPILIMLSTPFTVPSCSKCTFGEFARRQADRLLMPWLFWSGLYLLLVSFADGVRTPSGNPLSVVKLLRGTSPRVGKLELELWRSSWAGLLRGVQGGVAGGPGS
jgi:hypothetical protein